MKKMFVFAALTLMTANSFGAAVKSAKLDASLKNILIDVTYGGGCAKHEFKLEIGACLESFPVQCSAKLTDNTVDNCEALLMETVSISLESAGLNDPYYQGASITIFGDVDWQTNQPSKATVKLP